MAVGVSEIESQAYGLQSRRREYGAEQCSSSAAVFREVWIPHFAQDYFCTIYYAFMLAVGMVNGHLVDCFCHAESQLRKFGR
jgi:3-methyladenine DNA glycosylase Tag